MTDIENKEEEVEETEELKPADKEKKFTQDDVNRFIQREKAKSKLMKEELDTLKTTKDETLTAYETHIAALVGDMAKDVPDPIKKLLGKLSPIDQLEYLSDPANNVVFTKTTFPLSKEKAKDADKEFKHAPIDNPF